MKPITAAATSQTEPRWAGDCGVSAGLWVECNAARRPESTDAGVATPADVDLDVFVSHRSWDATALNLNAHVFEARHVAAIDADEVWMTTMSAFELESPHVITQITSRYQTHVRQILEVAEERGTVHPSVAEPFGHVAVRERLRHAM